MINQYKYSFNHGSNDKQQWGIKINYVVLVFHHFWVLDPIKIWTLIFDLNLLIKLCYSFAFVLTSTYFPQFYIFVSPIFQNFPFIILSFSYFFRFVLFILTKFFLEKYPMIFQWNCLFFFSTFPIKFSSFLFIVFPKIFFKFWNFCCSFWPFWTFCFLI